MTYRPPLELGRPRWMLPLLVAWLVVGVPGYIGGLVYRGILNPMPDFPPDAVGLMLSILLTIFLFGSPVALFLAERKYRKAE